MNTRNIAFYKFVAIQDLPRLRAELYERAHTLGLKGTVLLAAEGINGSVAGSPKSVVSFEDFLKSVKGFETILFKVSFSQKLPFKKLLVKIKPEILTLGDKSIDPAQDTAPYIRPLDLKRALDDKEDLVMIDIRNHFEVEHGTFKDAIDPQTKSFSDFPQFVKTLKVSKDKKIVTFCTGGIRCEKGSALLKKAGFKNVFQLEGGILEYFAQTENAPHFEGKCFVFDERELLDSKLSSGA